MGLAVDPQLPERGLRRQIAPAVPPHNRLNAQHQFADAERFDHVIVHAQFEAQDAINLLALGGEHQHGNRGGRLVLLQLPAHVIAGNVGQHQVQQDDVRVLLLREPKPLAPAHGLADLVSGLLQVVFEDLLKVGLVFDDQDSGHGAYLVSPPRLGVSTTPEEKGKRAKAYAASACRTRDEGVTRCGRIPIARE